MLPYKTWKSLLWFVITWVLTICICVSMCTSYWLVGPPDVTGKATHVGFIQDCEMSDKVFTCNGIRTNAESVILVTVLCIIGVGVLSLVVLTALTLIYCFCDQLTACGRSFHTLAGIWQGTGALLTLIGIALFPLVWDKKLVTDVCVSSSKYHIGECAPGYSLYLGVISCILCYFAAVYSTSLDSETFRVTKFESMESLDTYKQSDI